MYPNSKEFEEYFTLKAYGTFEQTSKINKHFDHKAAVTSIESRNSIMLDTTQQDPLAEYSFIITIFSLIKYFINTTQIRRVNGHRILTFYVTS